MKIKNKSGFTRTIFAKQNLRGFTLIELILYMGLVSIFIGGAVLFAWDVIYGSSKSNVQLVINQDQRFVTNRIIYEIRNASAITSIASGSLCLQSATPARNPTRIYLSSNAIRVGWGGGVANCSSTTYDEPITNNNIVASSLNFTDRSSGMLSNNVEFGFTLSSNSVRQEWSKTEDFTGTAEIRSK